MKWCLLGTILATIAGCAAEQQVEIAPQALRPMPTARPVRREVVAEEIGKSLEGRPITMYRFGPPAAATAARPVLVIGGIHGNEQNGAELTRLLVDELRGRDPKVPVVVVPEANPDGLARNLRHNARRVDLNRNFPASNWVRGPRVPYFGGATAASEPETRAIVKLVEELRPRRILSIHSIAGDACNNFDGPGQALAQAMAAKNGYEVKASIGYPTPGSLGSWAGGDLGIAMVTLELRREVSGRDAWGKGNRDALLAFVERE